MEYQRVLYTNKLTASMRSKLRITSYDKRRSVKKNVYFVNFASNTDMRIADRIAKRIPDITLKPIQFSSSNSQREHQMSICNNRESFSSSPLTLLPPPATLSFISNYRSTPISPQLSPIRRANETLEERARRILGARAAIHQNSESIPTLQAPNFISCSANLSADNNYTNQYEKDKKQLIDNMKSCLKAIEMAQQATDHLYQLHNRGIECRETLNFVFKVHSTTFYLKATTSAQIKAAFSAGLRLSWSDIADIINVLKADIHHQQLFMSQVASAKYISSKIDSTTSIAMSSKLAYQLAKLSH